MPQIFEHLCYLETLAKQVIFSKKHLLPAWCTWSKQNLMLHLATLNGKSLGDFLLVWSSVLRQTAGCWSLTSVWKYIGEENSWTVCLFLHFSASMQELNFSRCNSLKTTSILWLVSKVFLSISSPLNKSCLLSAVIEVLTLRWLLLMTGPPTTPFLQVSAGSAVFTTWP